VHPEATFELQVSGRTMTGKANSTGGWNTFRNIELGQIEISQSGEQVINVKPADANNWKAINLRDLKLSRVTN